MGGDIKRIPGIITIQKGLNLVTSIFLHIFMNLLYNCGMRKLLLLLLCACNWVRTIC